MFRKVEDFLDAYAALNEATLKLFDRLTDDMLDQKVSEGHRTLGQLSWHIVVTVPEMMRRTGMSLSEVDPESPPPRSKDDIVAGYRKVSEALTEAIKAGWEDSTLTEETEMYGQRWRRGFALTALINHEIHHRGQMTVLIRQAGGTVPGLLGPSKEEWSQFGMPDPPY